MRGETRAKHRRDADRRHFNPLPSCEGRQHDGNKSLGCIAISIHSPHARGDVKWVGCSDCEGGISIHSPHARGDKCFHDPLIGRPISIHSPHARGDASLAGQQDRRDHFNPLPSCEGRQAGSGQAQITIHFNPLPSCEGRLTVTINDGADKQFQSTPLMRGETLAERYLVLSRSNFNPLPSCEGRR